MGVNVALALGEENKFGPHVFEKEGPLKYFHPRAMK
jgi:hypothetical protein